MGEREIKLGSTVKDPLTGVEGVVVSRTEYLHDVSYVGVQRHGTDGDGKVHSLEAFPEQRLQVLQTPEERIGVA